MKLHFLNKTYYFLLFELPCSQMIFECFCQKKYYFWKTLECDVFLYPKFDTIVVKLLNWRFSNFAKKSAKIYEIRIHRWTQFLRGGRFSKRFKFSIEILPCYTKKQCCHTQIATIFYTWMRIIIISYLSIFIQIFFYVALVGLLGCHSP